MEIGSHNSGLECGGAMLDGMLQATADYLPQFH
jgi:hypothetical protein